MLSIVRCTWVRRPDGNLDCGFTLLELIVVCALIGLLLVAGVPAFRETVVQDTLRSDSRKLIGYIKGVREKAVREQRPSLLIFDLAERRVYHKPVNENEREQGQEQEQEAKLLHLAGDISIRDIWTHTGGKIGAGVVELWISRQGYLDRSVVHLENREGEVVSLLLFPFLPDIEIRDGYYEPES